MATSPSEAEIVDPEAAKAEWLARLDDLVEDFQAWSRASGWRTRRISKTVEERWLGAYKVPVLLMEKDAVQVVLNPVARVLPEAEGTVDLYLAPAYDDIAFLTFEGGRWAVQDAGWLANPGASDAAERRTYPYNEGTIRSILDRMAVDG